jgi:hypothetical protein
MKKLTQYNFSLLLLMMFSIFQLIADAQEILPFRNAGLSMENRIKDLLRPFDY